MSLRHVALIAFALPTLACQTEPAEEAAPDAEPAATATPMPGAPPAVEVVAVDYSFQAPAEIPSGWSSFRLENRGHEPHFFVLWKLPEGKTIEDYATAVGPAFTEAYAALEAGTADKEQAGLMLAGLLPEWYAGVEPRGGVGMLTPGESARATLNLDPGSYVMECYVKTPGGKFHVELGMAHAITVTAEPTEASAPAADDEIALANDGIGAPANVPAGARTFAVRFVEHPPTGLGNDVHVVRLEEGSDLDAIVRWMDWMNVEGLRSPAPAPFLGGVEEMPAGHTAYFTVDLAPGRYAWVGEAPSETPQVEEFTVE